VRSSRAEPLLTTALARGTAVEPNGVGEGAERRSGPGGTTPAASRSEETTSAKGVLPGTGANRAGRGLADLTKEWITLKGPRRDAQLSEDDEEVADPPPRNSTTTATAATANEDADAAPSMDSAPLAGGPAVGSTDWPQFSDSADSDGKVDDAGAQGTRTRKRARVGARGAASVDTLLSASVGVSAQRNIDDDTDDTDDDSTAPSDPAVQGAVCVIIMCDGGSWFQGRVFVNATGVGVSGGGASNVGGANAQVLLFGRVQPGVTPEDAGIDPCCFEPSSAFYSVTIDNGATKR
jgi:hypothetical protein